MSDSLISQLSNRVQAFLAATGISQRKLAKLIKTDETHLSSFLAGRIGLSAEKSLRLMQILNSTKQQLELKLGRSAAVQIAHFQESGQPMTLHWLEIRHGAKICYAQWEDVGPFRTDSAGYVFGDERPLPNVNHGAGIDVSPAVRDYLGLGSLGLVDWRFVEQADVPIGPWSTAGRLENMEATFVGSGSGAEEYSGR